MHLSVSLGPGAVSSAGHLGDNVFSISPDGQWIVNPVVRDGRRQLFLRNIGQASGKPIDGSNDAERAFFSPDSKWVAFSAQGALKKLPISGGSPILICALTSTVGYSTGFLGGSWGTDDRIVFIPQFNAGIWSVSASGGEPQLLLAADEAKDRIAYIWPQALPDNKGILVSVVPNRATSADELDIAVLPAGAPEPRILVRGGTNGQYVASGHLVFARGDALLAVAFDLSRLDVIGTPVPGHRGRAARSDRRCRLFGVEQRDPGVRASRRRLGPDDVGCRRSEGRRSHRSLMVLGFFRSFRYRRMVVPWWRESLAWNDDVWTYDISTRLAASSDVRTWRRDVATMDARRNANRFWQPGRQTLLEIDRRRRTARRDRGRRVPTLADILLTRWEDAGVRGASSRQETGHFADTARRRANGGTVSNDGRRRIRSEVFA